ncbi:hypothetical protein NBRC116590_16490 [Pelagimonas sp. KU-00592-HH]|uniref:lipid A-modifier LpxR family protein n=1 Tax=Pelagimonas sp. KU-00592-HH TaxID=3127651 RepID=UPI003107D99F
MGRIASFIMAVALGASPAVAQDTAERGYLGVGRLFVNDLIGDGEDRWRTGSYVASFVWGPEWQHELPQGFGDLLELRVSGEIIQPSNLTTVSPTDRPYAGALTFGAHTHFQRGSNEFRAGADLVVIGPQTHLDDFQSSIHDALGMVSPSAAVLGNQIGNSFRPQVSLEYGRLVEFGAGRVRPFVEMQAGAESYARVGFDLTFGSVGLGDMMVRDSVTGHRYRALRHSDPGTSFVIGADMAKVFDSVYLPESRGYTLTDTRDRVRAGVHWQGEKHSVFYGVTWLGKEFVGQSDGQVVGAINLNIEF